MLFELQAFKDKQDCRSEKNLTVLRYDSVDIFNRLH